MKIQVQEGLFDPWAEVAAYQRDHLPAGKHGGTVVFVGTMRDFNDGYEGIRAMFLEHYPGMTERHLEKVCEDAMGRWDVLDCMVIHRVGEIRPDEPIVLVAVWSEHRAMAFDACRFIINDLKSRAPFWKREATPEGERWVEHNTQDPNAA